MERSKFVEVFVDKVLIGSVASVVSLFVLFNYNIQLKGFEAGQTQARSISTIAIKNKDAVLTAVSESISIANGIYYKTLVPEQGKPSPGIEMGKQILLLGSSAVVLESRFKESAAIAKKIEPKITNDLFLKYQDNKLIVGKPELDKSISELIALQASFASTFDKELAKIIPFELESFSNQYFETLPWYSQPQGLLVGAIVASLLLFSLFFLFSSPPAKAAEEKPRTSQPARARR